MTLERGHQGLQLLEQLAAAGHRERADHAHAGQVPGVGVQAEEQRADRLRAALVRPVPGDDAVRGALMLDLEHDPLVRLVRPVQRLGDQPVQPGPLELLEPVAGQVAVRGRRGQVHRGAGLGQGLLQCGPALLERLLAQISVVQREQVERHEVRRGLLGKEGDTAGRGVDPLQQGLEVQPPAGGIRDHDLPVHHAPRRQIRGQGLGDLREIPGHRALVAAADFHLALVEEDDRAETVPLGLEAERALGYLRYRAGQHRRDRRVNRKVHAPILPSRPGSPRRRAGQRGRSITRRGDAAPAGLPRRRGLRAPWGRRE